jgi:hypothetical protein
MISASSIKARANISRANRVTTPRTDVGQSAKKAPSYVTNTRVFARNFNHLVGAQRCFGISNNDSNDPVIVNSSPHSSLLNSPCVGFL